MTQHRKRFVWWDRAYSTFLLTRVAPNILPRQMAVSRSAVMFLALSATTYLKAGCAWAGLNDIREFPAPHSRCAVADQKRLLTTVGRFVAERGTVFEVVADAKSVSTSADASPGFTDPRITVFNGRCDVIWRQTFPSFGEVGFDTLDFPGRRLLHVVARSALEPGDQDLFVDELLTAVGETLQPLAPVPLGADKYGKTYIGRINNLGDFGIVITEENAVSPSDRHGKPRETLSYVYRWKMIHEPGMATGGYVFAGPDPLGKDEARFLKASATSSNPDFPLYKFWLGD